MFHPGCRRTSTGLSVGSCARRRTEDKQQVTIKMLIDLFLIVMGDSRNVTGRAQPGK